MAPSITWGTNLVHTLLQKQISEKAVVVDATMGNGHDTSFLAQLVGPEGKVFAFDVQQISLEKTTRRLQEKGYWNDQIFLFHVGHEKILDYVHEPIDAAMFNLGYLPGADHSIITKGETTIISLQGILQLLKKGGLVSIMIYYGHEGGAAEKEKVLSFLEGLPAEDYFVLKTQYLNQGNYPPIIAIIEKK